MGQAKQRRTAGTYPATAATVRVTLPSAPAAPGPSWVVSELRESWVKVIAAKETRDVHSIARLILAAEACESFAIAARPETAATNELRRWLRVKAVHWRPDFTALALRSLDRRAGRTIRADLATTPEIQHLARLVDKFSRPVDFVIDALSSKIVRPRAREVPQALAETNL